MSAINTKANADITAGLSIGDFTAGLFAASTAGRAPFAATLLDVTTFQSAVAAGVLSANTAGRAYMAASFFDAITVASAFATDCLTNANLLQLVQDGAFVADAATRALFAAGFVDSQRLGCNAQIETDGGLIAAGAAIPVTANAQYDISTGGAETNTLAIPTFAGQIMHLTCGVWAIGNRVVTVAQAINATGNNTITFNTVDDNILLYGVSLNGALRWRVVYNNGCTLTTV